MISYHTAIPHLFLIFPLKISFLLKRAPRESVALGDIQAGSVQKHLSLYETQIMESTFFI